MRLPGDNYLSQESQLWVEQYLTVQILAYLVYWLSGSQCNREISPLVAETFLLLYPTHNKVVGVGYILVTLCPSVHPASCVRSVASRVQDGFFPYLVQMIISKRGCVACDDP